MKYIHELKIGSVLLKNNVIVAPMAGVSDSAFRTLCMEYGAGLCVSEMISAKGVHYKSKGSVELFNHRDIENPFSVQIFGHEPEILSEAAKLFESMGAQIIDINMGCPVPKVCGNFEGSYLMNEPKLVFDIVSSVSKAVSIPVTVKMRRGFELGNETAPQVAKICEEAGASMVAVHGRFREQYYSGKSDLDVIRRVKESISVPVIASGDICSSTDAKRTFEVTGCDGIMVGRGALGAPWLFSEILNDIEFTADRDLIIKSILHQMELEIEDKGETIGVPEMRKHIAWYLKGRRNAASLKNEIFKANTVSEIKEILNYLV